MVAILDAYTTINQKTKGSVKTIMPTVSGLHFFSLWIIDYVAAQIADLIQNGPNAHHPTIRMPILAQKWPNLAMKNYRGGGRE
jgi:hypothetical protein